jgi:hypothetical protein
MISPGRRYREVEGVSSDGAAEVSSVSSRDLLRNWPGSIPRMVDW